jgi:hypothetical protein
LADDFPQPPLFLSEQNNMMNACLNKHGDDAAFERFKERRNQALIEEKAKTLSSLPASQ